MTSTGSQEWLCPADVASTPHTGELKVLVPWLAQRWIHICLSLNWALMAQTSIVPQTPGPLSSHLSSQNQRGSLLFLTTNGETEAGDGLAGREETLKLT